MKRFPLAVSLWLAGCTSIPDTYAPPVQRRPQTTPPPNPVSHYTTMSDPNVEAYLVSDFLPAGDQAIWRWTHLRPELRFRLETTAHLKFVMEFAIPEITFQQRGPVTLSVLINGRLLDKTRYGKGGQFRLEKPVPAGWLRTDAYNSVVMEVDKPWVAPEDGVKLGVILSSAGFLQ